MRWRLLAALLLLVFAASSRAAFGPVAAPILGGIVLLVAAYIRFTANWSGCAHALVAVLAMLVAMFFLPLINGTSREGLQGWMCRDALERISSGLIRHDEASGSLPPPCEFDKQGKPMHSWRVLILPYLEGVKYASTTASAFYKKYKLEEPWDGPNNLHFLTGRPHPYRCRYYYDDPLETSTATSYLAVVGSQAAWQRNKTTRLKEIAAHGLSASTVLLIETTDSGISWTEPKDFSLDDIDKLAGDKSKPIIRGLHSRWEYHNGYFYQRMPQGVHVALADGTVRYLPGNCLTADKLKTLLAVGGCTEQNIKRLSREENVPFNWAHCIGLPAWFVSGSLLIFMAVRGRKKAKKHAPVAEVGKSE
jgi:hypothetical protein